MGCHVSQRNGLTLLFTNRDDHERAKVCLFAEIELKQHINFHKCKIFKQDGAPCHQSKIVTALLKEKRIKVLDWPGTSPDLNPIENL